MSYLTAEEKSKCKFFIATVLDISDYYLSQDFPDFNYAQILSALIECETNYDAIGSNTSKDVNTVSVSGSTLINNYNLQSFQQVETRSSNLTYGQSLRNYYNSVERLINSLGYVF